MRILMHHASGESTSGAILFEGVFVGKKSGVI